MEPQLLKQRVGYGWKRIIQICCQLQPFLGHLILLLSSPLESLGFDNFLCWFLTFLFLFSHCVLFLTLFMVNIMNFWILHNTFIAFSLYLSLPLCLPDREGVISNSSNKIMTYEHKIHKMLSIRMVAEQFTNQSHVEI